MAAIDRIALSVVVPIYNEAKGLSELAQRCIAAARAVSADFELLLVDDASTDATPALLQALANDPAIGPQLRSVRLPKNAGQYAATLTGLRAARGDLVVVLDGDLQDPPERLGDLVRAITGQHAAVAFAVKTERDDAVWMRAGCAVLRGLQRWLSPVPTVPGAGSFCAMRRPVAQQVVAHPIANANLAAVLAAIGAPHVAVPYAKQARAHGLSRVGPVGLLREAWGSLAVTGALARLAWLAVGGALLLTSAALAFAVGQ